MQFKPLPESPNSDAHNKEPSSPMRRGLDALPTKLKTSSRPSSFHAKYLQQNLGVSEGSRMSMDCSGLNRGQVSPTSPASPAAPKPAPLAPAYYRASMEVSRSKPGSASKERLGKTKLSDPAAAPQKICNWPPFKKDALASGSLEMVQQRPAVHSAEAVASFESRHAWYTQPWCRAADDQGNPGGQSPTLADFKLQYEIGDGLTSRVYLAKIKGAKLMDPDKDDKVVLKAMRKDLVLEDKSCVKDVAAEEIRMLTSVQRSRHVIRLMGTFETATHVYLVMEWAPCDFFQLMSDHFGVHRYWCNVRIYAAQVLMALEDLHRIELIYCDLKPENLLVCSNGSVKLSDLGLATPFPKEGERTARICGTPEYMSPEMLSQTPSSGGYNYMTDLWSFGIFVHEVLTGNTPFKRLPGDASHDEIFDRIREHTSIDVDVKYNLTEEATSLILGLLTRDPSKRLGSQDLPGRYTSIRQHDWFAPLNWRALERGTNTPSIFPRANRSMYKPVSDI